MQRKGQRNVCDAQRAEGWVARSNRPSRIPTDGERINERLCVNLCDVRGSRYSGLLAVDQHTDEPLLQTVNVKHLVTPLSRFFFLKKKKKEKSSRLHAEMQCTFQPCILQNLLIVTRHAFFTPDTDHDTASRPSTTRKPRTRRTTKRTWSSACTKPLRAVSDCLADGLN